MAMKLKKEEYIKIFEDIMQNLVSDEAHQWLDRNGFFSAPASTKYHYVFAGGLFEHSLNVTLNLLTLTEKLKLQWSRPESPYLVGMFHDLCKIDQYIWNPILKKYEWNADQPYKGHGDKSVFYIEKNICELTEEEKACIRWHMGAFDEKENWTKYTTAIHEFKNVLFTHTADMMASHIDELEGKE